LTGAFVAAFVPFLAAHANRFAAAFDAPDPALELVEPEKLGAAL